jgi:L-amino acid N-acyltransferase YncA
LIQFDSIAIVQEFRGKGFARIVVAAILDSWVKQGYGCAPFAYINDSNTASLKVFASLGFLGKCNCVTWAGLKLDEGGAVGADL